VRVFSTPDGVNTSGMSVAIALYTWGRGWMGMVRRKRVKNVRSMERCVELIGVRQCLMRACV
jgi:hypothetical protein